MKRLLLIVLFFVCLQFGYAQTRNDPANYPYGKFTVAPGLGTHLMSIMGAPNAQVSNLLQYNIYKRISLVSYISFSYGFPNNRIVDVQQHYSYSIDKKFGFGTSLFTKKGSNSFYLLAGVKYDSYSGTLSNEQLPETITTKTSSFTVDYGIMYNLRLGRNKYFMSTRLYIPLKDGLAGMSENANLELGVGIRIR
ncbi:hypothetical protein [Spirosoma gilvum]